MAQDLSELAGGEFARSTGAADHLGQPLPAREHRHAWILLRARRLKRLALQRRRAGNPISRRDREIVFVLARQPARAITAAR
jgi:hypothetical protein